MLFVQDRAAKCWFNLRGTPEALLDMGPLQSAKKGVAFATPPILSSALLSETRRNAVPARTFDLVEGHRHTGFFTTGIVVDRLE